MRINHILKLNADLNTTTLPVIDDAIAASEAELDYLRKFRASIAAFAAEAPVDKPVVTAAATKAVVGALSSLIGPAASEVPADEEPSTAQAAA